MHRKPESEKTRRHAVLATTAALVLAASPVTAVVGAGSASAAESPQKVAHSTVQAVATCSPGCVCGDGYQFCPLTGTLTIRKDLLGSSFRPYYAVLKALKKVPGVSVSTTQDGWVVYILPYIEQ